MVVGELKLAFSLELVLQGVDRTAACDEVWFAVSVAGRGGPPPAGPTLSAPPSKTDRHAKCHSTESKCHGTKSGLAPVSWRGEVLGSAYLV